MPKATIKNILKQGARYVHHEGGQALLRPGESKELSFTAAQMQNFPSGISVDGERALASELNRMDDDGLRDYIEKRDGKAPAKSLNRDKLIEMAQSNPKADEAGKSAALAEQRAPADQQKAADDEAARVTANKAKGLDKDGKPLTKG